MRIGIDARFYGPEGKGLGRYVQRLLEHLQGNDGGHAYVVFLRKENFDAFQPTNPAFSKVLADFRWYSLAEQLALPRVIARARCDLVHFPHYNVPLLYHCAFVVTIHDLILSLYPTRRASTLGPFLYWIKHAMYAIVIRSAVRRAKVVLTVSEYSKKAVVRMFRIPPEKVIVTYEAADPYPPVEEQSQEEKRSASYGSYLLYVGNAYPHKNIETLLKAFAELRRHRSDVRLILVGKMDYFYQRLRDLSKELGLAESVVFAGYVTDAELGSLYRHATLYVFPSFEEGFGLPPLEAMQAGVPVASSKASCMPEILGDAAMYFDPHDASDMASVLEELLHNDTLRTELMRRGFDRVKRYSWSALARKTLSVYTEVGDGLYNGHAKHNEHEQRRTR